VFSMAAQHCKARLHPKKACGMCGPHCMPVVHAASVSINQLYTVAVLLTTTEKGIMPCLSHHGHNTNTTAKRVALPVERM